MPVIDLSALSLKLSAAPGPERSARAFCHYPANSFPGQDKPLADNTHHDAVGAGAAQTKSGDRFLAADELWRGELPAPKKTRPGDLTLAADAWWRLAGRERSRWWAWVASGRDERTARCRWDARPDGYRAVVPDERHAAGGQGSGITGHVERFRATARARCGRFVRKTRSVSTCEWNPIGSLWDFIRPYNACRRSGHYPGLSRTSSDL